MRALRAWRQLQLQLQRQHGTALCAAPSALLLHHQPQQQQQQHSGVLGLAAAQAAQAAQAAAGPAGAAAARRCSHAHASTSAPSAPAAGRASSASIIQREADKFAALAGTWWDPAGPFAPLHRFNPARVAFIRDATCAMQGLDYAAGEPFAGLRVLDVGCGGGILSESMARLGARVHGVDITQENTAAASQHAALDPLVQARTRFECVPAEALLGHAGSADSAQEGPYDLVLASEVLEHVKAPDQFCATLAQLAAPGGTVILSTLNRTPASFALAIVGAEYVARVVPRGTHDWDRFITPEELHIMAAHAGLVLAHVAGIQLQPASGRFVLSADTSVNYIAAFHKPREQ